MGQIDKECPKNTTSRQNGCVKNILVKLTIEPTSKFDFDNKVNSAHTKKYIYDGSYNSLSFCSLCYV
jgi:hypothetical protein